MEESHVYSSNFNGVECLRASHKGTVFNKHVHEEYAICVIEKGAQSYFHKGENKIAVEGDIAIINPDEVHTGKQASPEGWSYQAIYPTEATFRKFSEGLNLGNHYQPYFDKQIIKDKQLSYAIIHTLNEIENHSPKLLTDSLFYFIFTNLLSRYDENSYNDSFLEKRIGQVKIVKEYIRQYFIDDIGLETLSDLVQLTPPHIIRSFKKTYGISPHAYQIQLRVEYAKKLLRSGAFPAEVAQSSGFYDQSHLYRFFKRTYGMSPKKYIEKSILYNF
ncbi:AraC family transcriptional regulator [Marinomonas sp. 2405UD68-3]|uniref:AraC family transcriptional regulator n=1 Tax=Marinomonas sp. 2405UD68-3 TaxID=3391835 RepID=UPI0039C8EB67